MSEDNKALEILASRLAESVLMDWDKEEQVRLAKEVACECHKNQVFVSLVKRMRDTQQDIEMMERIAYKWTVDDHFKYDVFLKDKTRLEEKVDEYLKKMEE